MTLTDAGALFALVDPKGQPELYRRCRDVLPALTMPLMTTWPALTEAFYLAGQRGGRPMQQLIGLLILQGSLEVLVQTTHDFARMDTRMEQYRDVPMDLADASLLIAADTLGFTRVFSLDSDFYIYRTEKGTPLEIIPGLVRR